MDKYRLLILVGVVLIVSGVVWYFVPFFGAARAASVSAPLFTVTHHPSGVSSGPWTFSLPPHDQVSSNGDDRLFSANVPAGSETWCVFVVVRTMPKGYYVGYGIRESAWSGSSNANTWWTAFQGCNPKVPDVSPQMPSLGSSRGGVCSLKKGGYALVFDVDALDLSSPGHVFVQWISASQVDAWLAAHRNEGQSSGTSPRVGGLALSLGGVGAAAFGVFKSGVLL